MFGSNAEQSHKLFSDKSTDPLLWWKGNEARFPSLAVLSKSYLCVLSTSTPFKHLLSTGGQRLLGKILDTFDIVIHSNIHLC